MNLSGYFFFGATLLLLNKDQPFECGAMRSHEVMSINQCWLGFGLEFLFIFKLVEPPSKVT